MGWRKEKRKWSPDVWFVSVDDDEGPGTTSFVAAFRQHSWWAFVPTTTMPVAVSGLSV